MVLSSTLETLQSDSSFISLSNISALDEAVIQQSSNILTVILRYRLENSKNTPGTLSQYKHDADAAKFLLTIYAAIQLGQPIRMCLPAFPFKSPNTTTKVLGRLPDLAEEYALAHLNGLCAAIEDQYPPGAELTIVSDGLVYNDLLGVPDRDVWSYGQHLRKLVEEKHLKHIKFSRLQDLLPSSLSKLHELTEITYVSSATDFRRALLNNFSRADFDPDQAISTSEDTCLTYRGYIKFLETDLRFIYPVGPGRSKSQFKRGVEYIAKQMLRRGDAFARAVREKFPDHLRLSIHPSTGRSKLSISLLPTQSQWTTPWHCAIGVKLDGTITTAPREIFDSDTTFELVLDIEGRPHYYREKTDLLMWDQSLRKRVVRCDPLYPCGLLIYPAEKERLSIEDVDARKVRRLAELNSPIVLRGFSRGDNRELFVKKAEELGIPLPWNFGLVLEVKDLGEGSRGSGNSLSSEHMPFHYDGVFKVDNRIKEDGTKEIVPLPPRLQFFTAVTPSPRDTGFTLFSSSRLFFRHLPAHMSLDKMRSTTWAVSTPSFGSVTLRGMPLVVQHPVTNKPCLRYHEHWPQMRTKFETMEVAIEGVNEKEEVEIRNIIDTLLYDRRVTYWHSWEKGDLVVNDNISMLHTRTAFTGGSSRELWRIHID
ncbi:hypothetical protein CVT24_003765 [Panaeolus cyanescens]|uniref:TauD/TfdA-like domain-containing protein n=1 Tax=Panaeolus cyanescens TaxID=181874 RepID=A0A409WN47_9AGAR|nr:hypothetical protein CVT24_003765 [Panaeolus cyanescens]